MRAQKNYQKMLEATIAGLKEQNRVPTLLLHSCCAPCSSYCLEYLSQYFHITVDYYNPNIYPEEEYHMRVQEQQRLIRELPAKYPIAFREGAYDKERFYEMARGMEEEKFSWAPTNRSASFPWQRDTKRNQRAANAASGAMSCA